MDLSHQSSQIDSLWMEYLRASRCWRSSNLKTCLLLCDGLSKKLLQFQQGAGSKSTELERLKNLTWYLKIRCLADDYYLNEPLLLSDDDLDDEDGQVRLINQRSSADQSAPVLRSPLTAGRPVTAGRKLITTAGSRLESRHNRMAAILTGKRSSLSSRQSSTSSYRPLTTSLTATQTAFSRSTRPLLKYVACSLLAKDLFEYLYNVQTITNKCPDYRQCLEYLNLVRKSSRKNRNIPTNSTVATDKQLLLDIHGGDSMDGPSSALGGFWLISFGICYYNLRMNKEAQEYFDYAREFSPKDLDAYTWLVKVYLRTNQPSLVLKTCQIGLQHCQSSILYNWMARVQSLMNDGLYKANLSLRESLKFHPTNIEALANVGHFAFYADKPELSLKCFERIEQLSINQSASLDSEYQTLASFAQLLNNLALSYFNCGYYHKVVPLFFKALLQSPSKEVTSDIWYNLSFVPLSFGFINLSMVCLKLSLRNDSQNLEALNNLGVLKSRSIVDDEVHFANKQELWGISSQKACPKDGAYGAAGELDEIPTFFRPSLAGAGEPGIAQLAPLECQPEMLYNMAVIERRRGQLLASMRYCQLYSEQDQNNHHIQDMMREIRQLVSHTG